MRDLIKIQFTPASGGNLKLCATVYRVGLFTCSEEQSHSFKHRIPPEYVTGSLVGRTPQESFLFDEQRRNTTNAIRAKLEKLLKKFPNSAISFERDCNSLELIIFQHSNRILTNLKNTTDCCIQELIKSVDLFIFKQLEPLQEIDAEICSKIDPVEKTLCINKQIKKHQLTIYYSVSNSLRSAPKPVFDTRVLPLIMNLTALMPPALAPAASKREREPLESSSARQVQNVGAGKRAAIANATSDHFICAIPVVQSSPQCGISGTQTKPKPMPKLPVASPKTPLTIVQAAVPRDGIATHSSIAGTPTARLMAGTPTRSIAGTPTARSIAGTPTAGSMAGTPTVRSMAGTPTARSMAGTPTAEHHTASTYSLTIPGQLGHQITRAACFSREPHPGATKLSSHLLTMPLELVPEEIYEKAKGYYPTKLSNRYVLPKLTLSREFHIGHENNTIRLTSVPDNRVVMVHYTSKEGLQGILRTGEIWLSQANSSSHDPDTTELPDDHTDSTQTSAPIERDSHDELVDRNIERVLNHNKKLRGNLLEALRTLNAPQGPRDTSYNHELTVKKNSLTELLKNNSLLENPNTEEGYCYAETVQSKPVRYCGQFFTTVMPTQILTAQHHSDVSIHTRLRNLSNTPYQGKTGLAQSQWGLLTQMQLSALLHSDGGRRRCDFSHCVLIDVTGLYARPYKRAASGERTEVVSWCLTQTDPRIGRYQDYTSHLSIQDRLVGFGSHLKTGYKLVFAPGLLDAAVSHSV